ncbi:hypothetical protein PAMA_005471 [Pampus argenteus]
MVDATRYHGNDYDGFVDRQSSPFLLHSGCQGFVEALSPQWDIQREKELQNKLWGRGGRGGDKGNKFKERRKGDNEGAQTPVQPAQQAAVPVQPPALATVPASSPASVSTHSPVTPLPQASLPPQSQAKSNKCSIFRPKHKPKSTSSSNPCSRSCVRSCHCCCVHPNCCPVPSQSSNPSPSYSSRSPSCSCGQCCCHSHLYDTFSASSDRAEGSSAPGLDSSLISSPDSSSTSSAGCSSRAATCPGNCSCLQPCIGFHPFTCYPSASSISSSTISSKVQQMQHLQAKHKPKSTSRTNHLSPRQENLKQIASVAMVITDEDQSEGGRMANHEQ